MSGEYVRTFNRFELKYLVDVHQCQDLLRRIEPFVVFDSNAGPGGTYKVASVYWDSPDLRCYWEKMDGEKYRRKVRLRTYGPQPTEGFLEIKQRYNLNVQKRRVRAPLDELEEVTAQILAGTYPGGRHDVYDEVFVLTRKQRLEPKMLVSYNRMALFDRRKSDLRITLDMNIRCRHLDLDLRSQRMRGSYALPPTMRILEVKFNEMMPRWLASHLNALGLQIQRLSKYCCGVERSDLHLRAVEI